MAERNGLNFLAISNSGMKIVHELSKHADFLKLSRLMTDEPLKKSVRMEELMSDLISESGDQNGLFILTPAVETVALEKRVYINFFPFAPVGKQGVNTDKSIQQTLYTMNIFVPNDYALINCGTAWRGMLILDEISKIIDRKHLTGVGKVVLLDWEQALVKNNNSFTCISVTIGVNHAAASKAFEREI